MTTNPLLIPTTDFVSRHLGPRDAEIDVMLERCGCDSLDGLAEAAIPSSIRLQRPLAIGAAAPPHELLAKLREIASRNQLHRSYIGMGYHNCHTPPVIQRSVFENPGWYTQYTPYQAEISQGRLEALLIFQTMIGDLTGLPLANASLLDEATAAAEAMTMCRAIARSKRTSKSDSFYVADSCHPQTIAVLRTRAKPVGIDLQVGPLRQLDPSAGFFGVLVQYPDTDGRIEEPEQLAAEVHETGGYLAVACDLLALTLLRPPGEFGADIAVGSAQRFGVPLGCGGPHAAFLSTTEDNKRQVPGRIVGVSRDSEGKPAYRLALQTREQHIRRDRATSNICTAQVLTAIMSAFYAVHHGPEGLRQIAERVHGWTGVLASGLRRLGYQLGSAPFFDTLRVELDEGAASTIVAACTERGINLRRYPGGPLGISLDETVTARDVADLLSAFAGDRLTPDDEFIASELDYPKGLARDSDYLTHPHFHCYRSEHEMLRYLSRLQGRDLSLVNSMIPLGSCTMKLNAAAEMLPLSWPEFADVHPFAPPDQLAGYHALFEQLEQQLAEITGLPAVSLQPNSGAQGEYAGLLVIRQFHEANGDSARNVCLIPMSAHGTNPASAVMTGFDIVAVACDGMGNIDVGDLAAKAEKYKERLGALMVTYPSTHGVFESAIQEICSIVHKHGGRVYLDGANMNAQVGLCRPGDYGADVCHLNLHKTFAMPHGGGGPGVGPIAASEELAPFLPGHPLWRGRETIGPVAAAPFGSPLLLPISWLYIGLMGGPGLERASQVAILNANYMEQRLDGAYEIVFRGESGYVAHEFIIDCRPFKKSAGIVVDDVAKRLMDFGFHAPTMSFPVAGTLMIEPTESESKAELDRFCDAMIAIREEIRDIEEGRADREDNPLKNAPHTALAVTASEWTRPYSREQAAYPASWLREHKFWPPVARVDNPYGDRHLFCCCPLPVE